MCEILMAVRQTPDAPLIQAQPVETVPQLDRLRAEQIGVLPSHFASPGIQSQPVHVREPRKHMHVTQYCPTTCRPRQTNCDNSVVALLSSMLWALERTRMFTWKGISPGAPRASNCEVKLSKVHVTHHIRHSKVRAHTSLRSNGHQSDLQRTKINYISETRSLRDLAARKCSITHPTGLHTQQALKIWHTEKHSHRSFCAGYFLRRETHWQRAGRCPGPDTLCWNSRWVCHVYRAWADLGPVFQPWNGIPKINSNT